MTRDRPAEDAVMDELVGEGSHEGSTWFGKFGDVVQQPPVWAGIAGALALAGPKGRRAALRGSVCYAAAAVAHIVIKPMVERSRPPRSGRG